MNSLDTARAAQFTEALRVFNNDTRDLPAIASQSSCESFVGQLIDGIRRVRYVQVIGNQELSPSRADPSSELFDPIRAAILHRRAGGRDEAFWLVWLSVHFGKHVKHGWRLVRDIYGALGATPWSWKNVARNPAAFRKWLDKNQATLLGGDGIKRAFGNHRKYQSLDAHKPSGTGAAVESYVQWVGPPRRHDELFAAATKASGGNPRKAFDALYKSLEAVTSFGRTARFDYLNMIRKTGLAAIEAGSTYLIGATGPLNGARLLFGPQASGIDKHTLDSWLMDLAGALDVTADVLEDAICNWQKSPGKYRPFRG